MKSIYGQESSFGKFRRSRGATGAAGDFHLEKATAERYGLSTSKENDQRFDVRLASVSLAKYVKDLNEFFEKPTVLGQDLTTIPVSNSDERKKFAIAALNAGEGRIAKAQQMAKEARDDPAEWNSVAKYLGEAGATKKKIKEITEYVEKINTYEDEFRTKSEKATPSELDGHWITDHSGRHIFIKNKK